MTNLDLVIAAFISCRIIQTSVPSESPLRGPIKRKAVWKLRNGLRALVKSEGEHKVVIFDVSGIEAFKLSQ